MKAFWCWQRAKNPGRDLYFEDAVKAAQANSARGDEKSVRVCEPEVGAFEAYGAMLDHFKACEDVVCNT